jgi:very-short-patch-repair endonuclease
MSGESLTQQADRVIAGLATRQHGVVARWQLTSAGVTRDQIDWRLTLGRLHELHRGVYLVGHVATPQYAQEMAALLAFRLEAVLSHRSAAALWQLLPYPATTPVWVTIAPERSAERPNIKTFRATLDRKDIRHRHRMALTSPPRTILDLAAQLGDETLERVVSEAAFHSLATESELHVQLKRNPHKRGNARLRRILDLPGGPKRTRSPAEVQMLRLLRRAGITGFETNARIRGYEVDFLWRELNLVVEVDGYDAHSGRWAFERDRVKIAHLQAHGLDVIPVTPRRLRDDPDGFVALLLGALERADA